jgi:predicted transcriptional regulator
VLAGATEYQEQARRLALLERIVQAERDFADGRTYTQEEVEAMLDQWPSGED